MEAAGSVVQLTGPAMNASAVFAQAGVEGVLQHPLSNGRSDGHALQRVGTASRPWWPKDALQRVAAPSRQVSGTAVILDTGQPAHPSKPPIEPPSAQQEEDTSVAALAKLLGGASPRQQPPSACSAVALAPPQLTAAHTMLNAPLSLHVPTMHDSIPKQARLVGPLEIWARSPMPSGQSVDSPGRGGGGVAPAGSGVCSGSPVCAGVGVSASPRAGSMMGGAQPLAWLQEGQVLCVAVFLTRASQEVLVSMVPPRHAQVAADAMVLVWDPTPKEALGYPLGAEVALKVIGKAANARTQAAMCDPPPWLPTTTTALACIPMSTQPGASAGEAGSMLEHAFQVTGLPLDCGGLLPGEGGYEHLPGELEVVGHVGVELHNGHRLFSVAQLVEAGLLTWGPAERAAYTARHAHLVPRHLPKGLPEIPVGSQRQPVTPTHAAPPTPDASSPARSPVSPLHSSNPPPALPAAASAPTGVGSFWPPGLPRPFASTPAAAAAAETAVVAPSPGPIAVAVGAPVGLPPLTTLTASALASPYGSCTPPQEGMGTPPSLPPMLPFTLPAAAVPVSSSAAPGALLLTPVQAAPPQAAAAPGSGLGALAVPVTAAAELPAFLQAAAPSSTGGGHVSGLMPALAPSSSSSNAPPALMPVSRQLQLPFATPVAQVAPSAAVPAADAATADAAVEAGAPALAAGAAAVGPVSGLASVASVGVASARSVEEDLSDMVALLSPPSGEDVATSSAPPAPGSSDPAPAAAVMVAPEPAVAPLPFLLAPAAAASAAVVPGACLAAPASPVAPAVIPAAGTAFAAAGLGDSDSAAVASPRRSAEDDVASEAGTTTSSSSDMPTMQRTMVHVGDYVLLQPWGGLTGAEGNALVEGWVKDHASDEPWQPEGVLVVLSDNTIGHVLRVLDAPSLAAATTTASSRHHKHKPAAAAAAAGYQPGAELGVAGDAILDQFTMGGSLLVAQGSLASGRDACAAAGPSIAVGAGAGEEVAALFQRFTGLQQRFGEAMCEGVLAGCGFDFQAACEELEGQAALLEGGGPNGTPTAAAAAAGGMSSWEQPTSDHSWHGGSPPPAQPLVAAAVEVAPELPTLSLRQLAEEAGVAWEAAEQLSGMLGEVGPQQVVAALLVKGGEVNAAAEALLSGEPLEQQQQPLAQQAQAAGSPSCGSPLSSSFLSDAALRQQRQFERLRSQREQPVQAAAPPVAVDAVAAYMGAGKGQDGEEEEAPLASSRARYGPAPAGPQQHSPPGPSRPYRQQQQQRVVAVSGAGMGGYGQRGLAESEKQQLRDSVDELRRAADKAFQAQRILLAAYQAAEAEGAGSKAAGLMAQAREMAAKGKALVDEANAAAWRAHNRCIRNTWEIDLHLMGAKPAMEKLIQQLTLIKAMDSPGGVLVRVITGRGNHSKDGVPAIRNRVTAYLADEEFEHSIDPDNPGMVLVHIGSKSTGGAAG